MGWLRNLMADANPAIRSYGALARMALAHRDWPPDGPKPQPRSFASLCSKLDRGLELEWLADRPGVQRVLGDVLGAPTSAIGDALGDALEAADDASNHVRLRDVPYARPMDLLRDRLPPGIPQIVARPSQWQKLWWYAPSGTGRTLAGRWLAARGLATYIVANTSDDARLLLPATGAAFVELHRIESATSLLDALPSDQVCVAAPYCPEQSALVTSNWTKIISPAPLDYLPELIAWIEPRLSADGHFQADRVDSWLQSVLEHEALHTFGALLGLAGLFDEIGPKEVEGAKLDDVAQRWIERRVAATSDPTELTARRDVFKMALGLVRATLTDSDEPPEAPRTADQWVRLVPEEFQRNLDAEWIRLSVSKSTNPVTKKELERALKNLPPGAFEIVRIFEKAGILVRSSDRDDALSLAPRWLVAILVERAMRDLTSGSAFEWGEAILRPHATRDVFRCVQRRFGAGESVEDVLDLEEVKNPAYAAALEATFRSAGLSLLQGADLSVEYLEALWDAQLEILVPLGELPFPRIVYPDAHVDADLRVGAWCLAALAISEQLPSHRGRRHLLLRPWLLTKPASAFTAVLDAIHAVVAETDGSAPWAAPAYVLAAKLDDSFGDEVPLHALNAPNRLIAAAASGNLSFDLVEALDACAWRSLTALCAARGANEKEIWRAVWRAWEDAGRPASHVFESAAPVASKLWQAASGESLAHAISAHSFGPQERAYESLDSDQCRALLDALRSAGVMTDDFWASVSDSFIGQAIAARDVDETAARVLWHRAPSALLDAIDGAIATDPAWTQLVLAEAPGARTAELVSRLRRSSPSLDAQWLHSWLYARIRDRSPGWRDAYALLAESLESTTRE